MVPRKIEGTKETKLEALLGKALRNLGVTLATAESCTGGLLSGIITSVAGSSDYFIGGVVAYSNEVKKSILGVSETTLKRFGAVSSPTARQMARGVRIRLNSDIGISITGVAGPGGGSPEKPVGTVFIGLSVRKKSISEKKEWAREFHFNGGRGSVRKQSVEAALEILIELLG